MDKDYYMTFFDENGILIYLMPTAINYTERSMKPEYLNSFSAWVGRTPIKENDLIVFYKERTKAEEVAFIKAFEILEDKLQEIILKLYNKSTHFSVYGIA